MGANVPWFSLLKHAQAYHSRRNILTAGAADRLDATASYLEDHDLRKTFRDLRKFARQHLTGSLVFAVAIGILAGAALNRTAHSYGRTSDAA